LTLTVPNATGLFANLFGARLSRRIVLWIFASIVVIEGLILVPSVYRREREFLHYLKELALARTTGRLAMAAHDPEDLALNLALLLEDEDVVGGSLYQTDGTLVTEFGEAPKLGAAELQAGRTQRYYRTQQRYDALWPDVSLGQAANDYQLVIRHDAAAVNREVVVFIGRIAGLVLIIAVFVTGVTVVGLSRILISPVLALRRDLLQAGRWVSSDNLATSPQFESLPQQQRQDELGEVITAFDQMYGQIVDAIRQRQQAEKALAQLAEIGELAAMIVHEVRNPLTTVLLGLTALRRSELPPRDQIRLDLALDEAQRLQRLLNEILRYARSPQLSPEPLDLNALIEKLLPTLQTMPAAKGRSMRFCAGPTPAWVEADPDKLHQVVNNLVSNAYEASPPGTSIDCTVVVDPDLAQVQFQVSNVGEPIPPDLLPQLTQPFLTTKPSGTGLGLAITRRIIEAHGGKLDIQSNSTSGTQVTATLPYTRKAVPEQ
jgi:signal transduction histidine kinase